MIMLRGQKEGGFTGWAVVSPQSGGRLGRRWGQKDWKAASAQTREGLPPTRRPQAQWRVSPRCVSALALRLWFLGCGDAEFSIFGSFLCLALAKLYKLSENKVAFGIFLLRTLLILDRAVAKQISVIKARMYSFETL